MPEIILSSRDAAERGRSGRPRLLRLLRHQRGAAAEALLPVAPLRPWYERVDALGHGTPRATSATEALDRAADTEPGGRSW